MKTFFLVILVASVILGLGYLRSTLEERADKDRARRLGDDGRP